MLKNQLNSTSQRCTQVLLYYSSQNGLIKLFFQFALLFSLYQSNKTHKMMKPGRVAQSVTCLATDAKLTADPGVASSILARSHTFMEIEHEIISTVILLA